MEDSAQSRSARPPATGRQEDLALEDLLREAEEALRESSLPSGNWGAPRHPDAGDPPGSELAWTRSAPAELAWMKRLSAVAGALSGEELADAEAAFWLLFPPRGNA